MAWGDADYPFYKSLSGRLSATFNLDGHHLARYVAQRNEILDELFEDLLLHDQIRIPSQDYLTVAGLVVCLGENIVLRMLEDNALRIARLRGVLSYARGTGRDGSLCIFNSTEANPKAVSVDVERSIDAGLSSIPGSLENRGKLKELLIRQTDEFHWESILESVRMESIADLKATELWRKEYALPNSLALKLPGMKKMQVRVIGPKGDTKPETDVVDRLLALTLWNAEMDLAGRLECSSMSSASPIGSLLQKKAERAFGRENASNLLLKLFEINRIPWLAGSVLADETLFDKFMNVRWSGNGRSFRHWFHDSKNVDQSEFVARYVDLLEVKQAVSTVPGKSIRFVITSLLKEVPVVGTVASFVDKFFVDSFGQMPSPKLFVKDLKRFGGSLAQSGRGARA
jgi:hypothetical protein